MFDSDFGITSKEPAEIIDSTMLVVFNCKTRKIGIYYPEQHATLKVKGTTIQFFDPQRSVQKTVRKPQEKLFKIITQRIITLIWPQQAALVRRLASQGAWWPWQGDLVQIARRGLRSTWHRKVALASNQCN